MICAVSYLIQYILNECYFAEHTAGAPNIFNFFSSTCFQASIQRLEPLFLCLRVFTAIGYFAPLVTPGE